MTAIRCGLVLSCVALLPLIGADAQFAGDGRLPVYPVWEPSGAEPAALSDRVQIPLRPSGQLPVAPVPGARLAQHSPLDRLEDLFRDGIPGRGGLGLGVLSPQEGMVRYRDETYLRWGRDLYGPVRGQHMLLSIVTPAPGERVRPVWPRVAPPGVELR